MTEGRQSISVVMDNLSVHPLLRDVPVETVARYTIDFMRVMGCPYMFLEKVACVRIRGHRGALPCDYYMINGLRTSCGEAYEAATATFHEADHDGGGRPTYKIQGGIVTTSLEDDDAELSYHAIDVDEDGFPTLPDNSVFLRALEAYVKMQWFTILFDTGRIANQVYLNAQQEYCWLAGQCSTEQNRMTLDRLEALSNSMNTLLQRSSMHRDGFVTLGAREQKMVR